MESGTDHPRMPSPLRRRGLVTVDAARAAHRTTDVLVLGSGVAGLSAARAAAADPAVRVLVVAKGAPDETATRQAQGGVAAVVAPEATGDSLAAHRDDTLEAGRGLADPEVVGTVVREGVDRVLELVELGATFDRDERGRLACGLEGGHSFPRIVHRGDTTGAEIQRVLLEHLRGCANVTLLERTVAVDLIADPEGVRGAALYRAHGEIEAAWAGSTVLATGGLGRLYRETTNPAGAVGDGVAMAFRAGATLADLEFVQFHPTTLYLAGADRFLITEALRGEGAVLRDGSGRRFMTDLDPRAELAPRDVVSRGITAMLRETGDSRAWLDLTGLPPARLEQRFPKVLEILRGYGIDPLEEPVPVRPSAHYAIGGVRTDLHGRTDLEGLLAAGEVAATGLHGANRLASNSLLEGLVLGHRAGLAAAAGRRSRPAPGSWRPVPPGPEAPARALDRDDLETSLRSLLWRQVGLERTGPELVAALEQIAVWARHLPRPGDAPAPDAWALANMLTTAFLVTLSALRRRESRGVHHRVDFPAPDDAAFGRRLFVARRDTEGTPSP